MFNCYDVCAVMVLDDGMDKIKFEYVYEVSDFDDYIEVETGVVIGDVGRGWIGDITFYMTGFDVNDLNERVEDSMTLKNVLCSARTFESHQGHATLWKYKFLKY